MARKRYTEEHIIGVLQEVEAGAKAADPCHKLRIYFGPFCYHLHIRSVMCGAVRKRANRLEAAKSSTPGRYFVESPGADQQLRRQQ